MDAFYLTNTEEVYVDFFTGQVKNLPDDISVLRQLAGTKYPGDTSLQGDKWVFETAETAIRLRAPKILMLYIAMPLLVGMNTPISYDKYIPSLFRNIRSFISAIDYTPVVLGMGDIIDCKGYAGEYESDIDGYISASLWSYGYAGVYGASEKDKLVLQQDRRIRKCVSRDEFAQKYNICDEKYLAQFPDILLYAKEGFSFNGIGNRELIHRIPAQNKFIPIYENSGQINSILDIAPYIKQRVDKNEKICLIMVEGVGEKNFDLPYYKISNYTDDYIYDHSLNQYMAITTGTPFYANLFPPIIDHRILHDSTKNSQYKSIFFANIPQNTIGRYAESCAVGSRCISTYASSGADITIECYCRNLKTLGNCVVINR